MKTKPEEKVSPARENKRERLSARDKKRDKPPQGKFRDTSPTRKIQRKISSAREIQREREREIKSWPTPAKVIGGRSKAIYNNKGKMVCIIVYVHL